MSAPRRHLSMLRSYTPADALTIGNAACGTIAIFLCLDYVATGSGRFLWIAFVLLGLASGFALPATKPERRIMGKTGRRIMSQAQEVGSQLINRGEEAAERTVETVKGAMKREGRSGR